MAKLILGTQAGGGFRLGPAYVTVEGKEAARAFHNIGVAGSGKSKQGESLGLQLMRQGVAVSSLDPHSDLNDSAMANLLEMGFFQQPGAYQRFRYVEFEHHGLFLPFNYLDQPGVPDDVIADDFVEACHRCWPELATGAAQFDTLVLNGVRVLLANKLPLPALFPLILKPDYRQELLKSVDNYGVRAYFENFDRLRSGEQADQSASTIRRLNILTSSPVLEYCLGQKTNAIRPADIIKDGISVLYNLGKIRNNKARQLIGALLMVGYERAALGRLGTNTPRTVHYILVDEFSQFSAQSSESLSIMIEQLRKANVFPVLMHQAWGQLGPRLHGSLQNVGVKMCMRVGRADAEIMAKWLGSTDPMQVKFEPITDRQYPATFSVSEQWEAWINALMTLPDRHALVRIGNRPAVLARTLDVPNPKASPQQVEQVKETYRQMLLVPQNQIELPYHLEDQDKDSQVILGSAPRY